MLLILLEYKKIYGGGALFGENRFITFLLNIDFCNVQKCIVVVLFGVQVEKRRKEEGGCSLLRCLAVIAKVSFFVK